MVDVSTMSGLGDGFYTAPAIRAYVARHGRTLVGTPWPEMFWDDPDVWTAPHGLNLSHVNENIQRALLDGSYRATTASFNDRTAFRIGYGIGPVVASIARASDIEPYSLNQCLHPAWIRNAEKLLEDVGLEKHRFTLVRPPTLRDEWPAPARNPTSKAFRAAWETALDFGATIAVGKLHRECLVDPWMPDNAIQRMHGELHWTTLTALCSMAGYILGSPSFLLPMTMAVGGPGAFIYGAHLAPEILMDAADRPEIVHITPSPFETCHRKKLDAFKEINPDLVRGRVAAHMGLLFGMTGSAAGICRPSPSDTIRTTSTDTAG